MNNKQNLEALVLETLKDTKEIVSTAQYLSNSKENLRKGMSRYLSKRYHEYVGYSEALAAGMSIITFFSTLATAMSIIEQYIPGAYGGLSLICLTLGFGGAALHSSTRKEEVYRAALSSLPAEE